MIGLRDVLVSQAGLRAPARVAEIRAAIADGRPVPPIELIRRPDGRLLIYNGHHRAIAYWTGGWTTLLEGEYAIVEGRWLSRSNTGPARRTVPEFVAQLRERGVLR